MNLDAVYYSKCKTYLLLLIIILTRNDHLKSNLYKNRCRPINTIIIFYPRDNKNSNNNNNN